MVVKLSLLITATMKGSQAFKQANTGLSSLTKIAAVAAAGIAAVGVAAVATSKFLQDSIQVAAEYSDEMQAVKAATQATTEEFAALDEKAQEIGRTFGKFRAREAAEGMRILSFAGFEVDEVLTSITPVMQLSQAGMIGLGDAANAVAGSLRSFGFDVSETQRIVDVMTKTFISSNTTMIELSNAIKFVAPIAAAAGIEFEELNATLAILANANIKGSRAGTNLRNILIRLQAPTGKAARTVADLNLQLFELPPAAQAAQRALAEDSRQLRILEEQMESTTSATKALQGQLDQLNIQEAENNLEMMRIRDTAADQRRDLTEDELSQIDKLQSASRDLAISQSELSIEQDKLRISEKALADQIDVVTVSAEANTEVFNSQKGELKSIAEIAKEFESALTDLSSAQQTESLATIFGLRNIAAFQIIMRGMSDATIAAGDSIADFTTMLLNAGFTAQEVSDIMEQGLGNQLKQVASAFEAFQLEVAAAVLPTLLSFMTLVKDEIIPALGVFIPIIKNVSVVFGLLVPVIRSLIPVAESFIGPIVEIAETIGGMVAEFAQSVLEGLDLVEMFDGLILVINAVLDVVQILLPFITMMNEFFNKQNNIIIKFLPTVAKLIELFGAILAPIMESLIIPLMDTFLILMDAFTPVFDAVIPLIDALIDTFTILAPIIQILAILLFVSMLPALLVLQAILIPLVPLIETFAKALTVLVESINKFVLSPVTRQLQKIANFIQKIVDGIKSIGGIKDIFKDIGGGLGDIGIPGFEGGGVVPGLPSEPVLIMAHGQEEIIPANERGRSGGITLETHDTINVTNVINSEADIDNVSQKLADAIVDGKRRAKQQLLQEAE